MQKRGDHTEMHFIRLAPCQQNHGVPAVMLPYVVAPTSMCPHCCAVALPDEYVPIWHESGSRRSACSGQHFRNKSGRIISFVLKITFFLVYCSLLNFCYINMSICFNNKCPESRHNKLVCLSSLFTSVPK